MEFDIRKNGYGVSFGLLADDEVAADYQAWFHDWREKIADLSNSGSLVLGGTPGAGKSHITQDAYKGAYADGSPVAMLSCHINSGSPVGRGFTEALLGDLATADGSLLVLDNLDFMVYTGGAKRRRSDKKVGDYAEFIDSSVRKLRDVGCRVLTTVHSELWRQNHSAASQDIWDIYEQLVVDLGGEKMFRGEIDMYNAADILLRRGIPFHTARDIAEALEDRGKLVFRQAHHIDPGTFIDHGIDAAIKDVNDLRDKKIEGGY